jgi:hypothetical protein
LANLLKPGGILYVSVPHINKPVEYKHYRHFTSESLTKELSQKFETLDVFFIEKRAYRKQLIDCILINSLFILNIRRATEWLYAYYKKNLFLAENEAVCQRIVVRAKMRAG